MFCNGRGVLAEGVAWVRRGAELEGAAGAAGAGQGEAARAALLEALRGDAALRSARRAIFARQPPLRNISLFLHTTQVPPPLPPAALIMLPTFFLFLLSPLFSLTLRVSDAPSALLVLQTFMGGGDRLPSHNCLLPSSIKATKKVLKKFERGPSAAEYNAILCPGLRVKTSTAAKADIMNISTAERTDKVQIGGKMALFIKF